MKNRNVYETPEGYCKLSSGNEPQPIQVSNFSLDPKAKIKSKDKWAFDCIIKAGSYEATILLEQNDFVSSSAFKAKITSDPAFEYYGTNADTTQIMGLLNDKNPLCKTGVTLNGIYTISGRPVYVEGKTIVDKDGPVDDIVFMDNQHNLRYATIQTYEYTIAQLKDYFSPDINIKHIKPDDAADFITTRKIVNKSHLGKKEKLGGHGRNNHLTNAKKIFQSAVKWNYLTKNPFEDVERCKPDKKSWHHIKPKEFNAILELAPDIRTKALYSVLYSGLRYGEAVNLTWATGIDFDRRRVNILNRDDGKYPFFKIKTYQQRSVPLCKQAYGLLQQLKEQSCNDNSPFVFITPERLAVVLERWEKMKQEGISHKWSNAYWLNNVRRDFVKYCEKAGIKTSEKLCLHVLRKSYAQNLADNGVPAITLCKLIGSTLRVVEQFYLRTSDANDKFAVEVLDRLMEDGESGE